MSQPHFGLYPDDVDIDEGYTLPRPIFRAVVPTEARIHHKEEEE
jgi:hypothetical protein